MAESVAVRAERGPEEEFRRRRSLPLYLEVWPRLLRTKPLGTVGLAIILVLIIGGVFANFIAPEGKTETHAYRLEIVPILNPETGEPIISSLGIVQTDADIPGPTAFAIKAKDPDDRFQKDSGFPWGVMGYDNLGRSMLSRVIHGAQISIVVGLTVVFIGTAVGVVIGMVSAWFGGKIDNAIQRVNDVWYMFPYLVLLIVIMAMLPDDPPIPWLGAYWWAIGKVTFGLSIGFIPWVVRIVRSSALEVRQQVYVDAALAMGASSLRINLVYVLPNIMAPIIVLATLNLGYAILGEAELSFLGFGIPPPNPSWGAMLSRQGKEYFETAPWIAFFPGLMVTLVVFGINMLGDALRDLLDPRLRGAGGQIGSGVVGR